MLKEPQANQDDIITANYYSAKAWMDKRNTDSAFHYFDKTAQLTTNERGVEARFQMAKIIFDEGDNDESMERAREVINDMPAYEEWVIKSYILIADIMVAKDKLMQAKASLKSIIDNYKGDPALLQLAQDKYDEVVAMEKRGSKIRMDGDNDEFEMQDGESVSYTHLRAHETR